MRTAHMSGVYEYMKDAYEQASCNFWSEQAGAVV